MCSVQNNIESGVSVNSICLSRCSLRSFEFGVQTLHPALAKRKEEKWGSHQRNHIGCSPPNNGASKQRAEMSGITKIHRPNNTPFPEALALGDLGKCLFPENEEEKLAMQKLLCVSIAWLFKTMFL